jgi:hypothetical protein
MKPILMVWADALVAKTPSATKTAVLKPAMVSSYGMDKF